VVHYAGVACDLDALGRLGRAAGRGQRPRPVRALARPPARQRSAPWRPRASTTPRTSACGEGGALVLGDRGLHERAEILREKGTNRARFFRGQVDKYTWVDVGSSYLPSEICWPRS
jgi:dTDP-4-amino-4,6-dideoxygalactose transaminase